MQHIEVNLLELDTRPKSPADTLKPKRRLPSKGVFFGVLLILAGLGVTAAVSYQQTHAQDSALKNALSLFKAPFSHFSENPSRTLSGELDDRINILLLGVGGAGHDGAQLTDTIMVASLKPSTKQVAFISLPRDLLVPIEGYGWRKINNANAFAEMANPGSGPEVAKDVVEKILNIPMHYTVRVDFAGFEQFIDALGGVDVSVEKSFTDYSYPTEDYKYQTVSFSQGVQTMDGKRALIFARSRHSGTNNEGSDFARSRRQQKLLIAVREKVMSTEVLLHPGKISEMITALRENITATIYPWELVKLALLAKGIEQEQIQHVVFDDSPSGLLVADTVDGAYVLQPSDGTYEQMQLRAQTVFDMPKNLAESVPVTLAIKNGTTVPGLAGMTSSFLSQYGFSPIDVGNANLRTYQETTAYDMTDGKKQINKELLEELLNVPVVSGTPQTATENLKNADVLIIVGSASSTTKTRE